MHARDAVSKDPVEEWPVSLRCPVGLEAFQGGAQQEEFCQNVTEPGGQAFLEFELAAQDAK